MEKVEVRSVLWENVEALMRHRGMKTTIDAIAEHTGVGRGTVQRMRSGDQSLGIDKLQQIAASFGLSTWQLLVPNLDASAPPALSSEPMPRFDFATLAYEHAKTFREPRQQAAIVRFLDEVSRVLTQLREERATRVTSASHP